MWGSVENNLQHIRRTQQEQHRNAQLEREARAAHRRRRRKDRNSD